MASIKDVAKLAGVGVGTVSRVLNNNGYVSDETREKIIEAMKELNYTPNELARNLFHQKTGIVAVLVPSISNPFFAEFVEHVENELHKCGYKTMLCGTSKEENAERIYLDMLNRHMVDGIIMGTHSLNVEEYMRIKKPIVALDRYLGEDIPVVAVDHAKGGRLAAEILIQNGCKSVLHFRGATAVESPYHDRHYVFEQIMHENGVQTYSYELQWNRLDMDYYRESVQEIMGQGIEFDGVFGVDRVAVECMNELIRRHKKIPRDVKIVAYDGTSITEVVEPKVTAIVQPIEELAVESVRLIMELINGAVYKNKRVMKDVAVRKGKTTTC